MALFTVSDSLALRNAIQLAAAGDVIELGPASFSVITLAKLPSSLPTAVPASGYTIQGNGRTVSNTRVLQQNVDGPFGPGLVQGTTSNLVMVYTSGGAADGTALLRATAANYTLNKVNFNGVHRGWDGNGGLYMSLASFNYASPVNVSLTFSNSSVNITGQQNFVASDASPTAGGSAFLHSWNNTGTVTLDNVNFNENGFLSSFHFLSFSPSSLNPAPLGNYLIRNNIFRRSQAASRVVRYKGNVLENVNATVQGNIFQDGSYLDIIGTASLVSFAGSNTFNTIAGGVGIRGTRRELAAATGNPVLQANAQLTFSGPGLPLRFLSNTNNDTFRLDTVGGGLSRNISIGAFSFQEVIAGGQGDDLITPAGTTTNVWINGDDGNDIITGSSGNDQLLGGGNNDLINGSFGSDSIDGGSGADTINGGIGNDNLGGGSENDLLSGDDGQDILRGDQGNDTLIGAAGEDTLTGGLGADVFKLGIDQVDLDTITDFSIPEDQLAVAAQTAFVAPQIDQVLTAANYAQIASLAAMGLADSNNKVVAIQSDQLDADIQFGSFAAVNAYVLVFNSDAGFGQLWYDADWSENINNRFLLASLTNVTSSAAVATFTNADFYVYA